MTSRGKCPACGRREKRSNEFNRLYWQLLTEMAETLRPDGRTYSVVQFHHYFALKYLGGTDMTLPGGRVLTIPHSTADLDTGEFSVYFAKVEAEAAERGVHLADFA